MIKIENVVLPSPEQWEAVIRGMRNPMNSWKKSDSIFVEDGEYRDICGNSGPYNGTVTDTNTFFEMGDNDLNLMMTLRNTGTDHRKFMRMIPVYLDITAPLYWWKEFDTYKVGTVANSCSTMHKIHSKEFTLDDFSHEHLINSMCMEICEKDIRVNPTQALLTTIECLNSYRDLYLQTKDKKYWWQMIQLIPSSYNQRRTVMLNYEILVNIYNSRKHHKLDEWREFCDWIRTLPYADELITDERLDDQ